MAHINPSVTECSRRRKLNGGARLDWKEMIVPRQEREAILQSHGISKEEMAESTRSMEGLRSKMQRRQLYTISDTTMLQRR
jgi:hypothetical protein